MKTFSPGETGAEPGRPVPYETECTDESAVWNWDSSSL